MANVMRLPFATPARRRVLLLPLRRVLRRVPRRVPRLPLRRVPRLPPRRGLRLGTKPWTRPTASGATGPSGRRALKLVEEASASKPATSPSEPATAARSAWARRRRPRRATCSTALLTASGPSGRTGASAPRSATLVSSRAPGRCPWRPDTEATIAVATPRRSSPATLLAAPWTACGEAGAAGAPARGPAPAAEGSGRAGS
mmetsp:Transcript_71642/g.203227  ORF Transcript_71642/g.203227 Transcript_71642/m.203227 type:complete len:201 (+) Transcript_71642:240-842(+)